MFWPDSLEETVRDNLRHALWQVRKALATASATHFLHADDLSIRCEDSSDFWLDATALEARRKAVHSLGGMLNISASCSMI
jgi:DNA-binding SARP family transcriptional activator